MNSMSRRIQVFIPAFDEAGMIGDVIEGLKRLDLNLDVFVIDDGSKDGTGKVAEEAGATVVRHPINLGGGAAIRTAFTLALLNGAEYIVTMDGDGQHDPKELPVLIGAMEKEKADLVIGSRFLENKNFDMELYRNLGIRFFSWLISKITKKDITDATCCYRIYNTIAVINIIPKIKEDQYYALETLIKIIENKANITEVSIKARRRTKGNSKKGIIIYCYNLFRVFIKALF